MSELTRPDPAPDASRARWTPTARRAAGCGIGCAVLVLLQVLFAAALIAVFFRTRPPAGMALQVKAPARVTAGETFPLTLVVRNEGEKPFDVSSISAGPLVQQQLALENPQPPPGGRPTGAFGTVVWPYARRLNPGETWTLRFDATAKETGSLRGALEVWSGLSRQPVPFSLEAAEQGAARKDAGNPGR